MKSDLHELTEEEAALVQLYRLADERGRNIIMGIAEIQYRLTIKSRIDDMRRGGAQPPFLYRGGRITWTKLRSGLGSCASNTRKNLAFKLVTKKAGRLAWMSFAKNFRIALTPARRTHTNNSPIIAGLNHEAPVRAGAFLMLRKRKGKRMKSRIGLIDRVQLPADGSCSQAKDRKIFFRETGGDDRRGCTPWRFHRGSFYNGWNPCKYQILDFNFIKIKIRP